MVLGKKRQFIQIRIATKISKNLKWLEKFLRRAKIHMPSLIVPRRLRSHLPSVRREQRTLGTCSLSDRTITLATHHIVTIQGRTRKKRKRVAMSQREILMTLAHEMAHFRYGLHDFEQEAYARTIFSAFGLKEHCPTCKGTGLVPARYVN